MRHIVINSSCIRCAPPSKGYVYHLSISIKANGCLFHRTRAVWLWNLGHFLYGPGVIWLCLLMCVRWLSRHNVDLSNSHHLQYRIISQHSFKRNGLMRSLYFFFLIQLKGLGTLLSCEGSRHWVRRGRPWVRGKDLRWGRTILVLGNASVRIKTLDSQEGNNG